MDILFGLGFATTILFYASYFAKQLALKQKGVSTNRLGRGDKPQRTRMIETLLKIATFSMAAVQAFSLISAQRWLLVRSPMLRFIGMGIALIGTAVFILAMITMKSSWRAGVDATQRTGLIQSGVYSISRNPAFLGFDLFYLGFTLAFSNPLQIVMTAACMTLLHQQILEEERFLPTVFGQEYLLYQQATHRYLGRITSSKKT